MGIKVIINGKEEKIEEDTTLLRLLGAKNIRQEVVTVELNENIVERDKFDSTIIKENDVIEFIYYMGGGN